MCPRLRDLIWQLRGLLTRIQSREGSTRGGAVSRETFRGLWNILGWTTFIQQGKNCIYGWEEQGAILAGGHGTGSLVGIKGWRTGDQEIPGILLHGGGAISKSISKKGRADANEAFADRTFCRASANDPGKRPARKGRLGAADRRRIHRASVV